MHFLYFSCAIPGAAVELFISPLVGARREQVLKGYLAQIGFAAVIVDHVLNMLNGQLCTQNYAGIKVIKYGQVTNMIDYLAVLPSRCFELFVAITECCQARFQLCDKSIVAQFVPEPESGIKIHHAAAECIQCYQAISKGLSAVNEVLQFVSGSRPYFDRCGFKMNKRVIEASNRAFAPGNGICRARDESSP